MEQERQPKGDTEDYGPTWAKLAGQEKGGYMAIAGSAVLMELLFSLFPYAPAACIFSFAFLSYLITLIAWWPLIHFRCPRYAKEFFSRPWRRDYGTKCCLHCGLPKGAERG